MSNTDQRLQLIVDEIRLLREQAQAALSDLDQLLDELGRLVPPSAAPRDKRREASRAPKTS